MIPLSAPSISAGVANAGGTAPSASPKGAEAASFAAMLGATQSAADAPQASAPAMAAALVAALAALPDGKSCKAGGKNLPDGEVAAHDDLETTETPDEAYPDQTDVPIAAAIPVLPLPVPPLPGTGNPVEFRAAVPDRAPARAAPMPIAARDATAAPTAQQAVQKQAVDQAAPPAQVLNVAIDPIVTAETLPQVGSKGSQVPAARTSAQIAPVLVPSADPQTLQQQSPGSNQEPLVLSPGRVEGSKDVEPAAAPASLATSARSKLRTSSDSAELDSPSSKLPGSRPTEAQAPTLPAKLRSAAVENRCRLDLVQPGRHLSRDI